jgi:hypothetical protein
MTVVSSAVGVVRMAPSAGARRSLRCQQGRFIVGHGQAQAIGRKRREDVQGQPWADAIDRDQQLKKLQFLFIGKAEEGDLLLAHVQMGEEDDGLAGPELSREGDRYLHHQADGADIEDQPVAGDGFDPTAQACNHAVWRSSLGWYWYL